MKTHNRIHITVSSRTGCFNLCNSSQRQFLVEVRGLPKESGATMLSETWDEDDAPGLDGSEPLSQVIEIMAERLESYWISTRRDAARKVIAWCREHAEELDRHWACTLMEQYRSQAEKLEAKAARLDVEYNLSSVPLTTEFPALKPEPEEAAGKL
jgi:hypothetical protein